MSTQDHSPPERGVPGTPPDLADDPRPELSDERRRLYDVVEVVDSMQRRATADFESVLRELHTATIDSVPGAQYACVTVVKRRRGVRPTAQDSQESNSKLVDVAAKLINLDHPS